MWRLFFAWVALFKLCSTVSAGEETLFFDARADQTGTPNGGTAIWSLDAGTWRWWFRDTQEARVSPDGLRVVYRFGTNLYLATVTGQAPKLLRANAARPSWSPQGDRIACYDYRGEGNAGLGLFILDLDGKELAHFSDYPQFALPFQPVSWSPDGTKIAYMDTLETVLEGCQGTSILQLSLICGQKIPLGSIFILDLETRANTPLTRPSRKAVEHERWSDPQGNTHLPFDTTTVSYISPHWSPDGSSIAVTRIIDTAYYDPSPTSGVTEAGGTKEYNVGIVPVTGGEFAPLTHDLNPFPHLAGTLKANFVLDWAEEGQLFFNKSGGGVSPQEQGVYSLLPNGDTTKVNGFVTKSLQWAVLEQDMDVKLEVEPKEALLCDEFELKATVLSLAEDPLTQLAPLEPPQIEGAQTVEIVGAANPGVPQTLAPGESLVFTWRCRAIRLGEARLSVRFRALREGVETLSRRKRSPTVPITRPDIIVNELGDQRDADPLDGCADVDPSRPGRQTTLRAAIETAKAVGGTNVIRFDLPLDSNRTIALRSPLPPVSGASEIQGSTQPGGGWVGIDCSSAFAGLDGVSALELQTQVKVNGLAFTGVGGRNFALYLSGAHNTVQGCRFGLNAAGERSSGNYYSIVITAGAQQIGGVAAVEGNVFGEGAVSVLITKPSGGAVPQGVVIEGNQFGLLDSEFDKRGPYNAISIMAATGTRIGGTSSGARNQFRSSRGGAVTLAGPETTENDIIGNWFGLKPEGAGVFFRDANRFGIALAGGAHHNRIGGAAAGHRNVIAKCDEAGIIITLGAHDNVIEGNLIGLTADGLDEAANHTGIWVVSGFNNRIGGTTPGQRNIISGNGVNGIIVGRQAELKFPKGEDPGNEPALNTLIEGNWIGLDHSGTHAVPNGSSDSSAAHRQGIAIGNLASGTIIGGDSPGRHNVISGNKGYGIYVEADPLTAHAIWGNSIGTSVDGTAAFPNRGAGILVVGEPVVAIGGTNAFAQNRIAYNAGAGVDLVKLKSGVPGLPLTNNLIYGNAPFRSIALASRPTPNDGGDGDSGPNGLQNWPLPRAAVNGAGVTLVALDLSSFARNVPVRLDVFQAGGGGGGKTPIGSKVIVTGSDPKDRYIIDTILQPVGTELTALATTPEGTSEFSPLVQVVSGNDGDGDGVPDALERQVPVEPSRLLGAGDPSPGDRNGDDIQDELQSNVASIQVLPAATNAPWLTVAAASGRTVSDLIALKSEVLPSLPGQVEVDPAAVRFRLGGGAGTPEAIQIWLPPVGSAPTMWILGGAGWTQLSGVAVQTRGSLRCVAFTLPAAAPDTDWTIALAQPWTSVPPLQLIAGPLEWRVLDRPVDEPVPGFLADTPPSPPRPEGWVLPLEIPWPATPGHWRLQTSPDLEQWDELDVPLLPDETTLRLASPPTDSVRFFRWWHY